MNGPKIVLIDADAPSRNYVAASLHQQGYEVLPAASGKEGLVTAWTDNPRLIVADPVLPDLTGEELAGLQSNMLVSHAPPLGRESVLGWLRAHGAALGAAYMNDTVQRFSRAR